MRRRKDAGFVSLVSVLIVAAMILVLTAIMLPPAIKVLQVKNESAAAETLAVINAAETVSATVYGQYVVPANLTGSLASPISCANEMLVPGGSTQAPDGYSLTFTGGGAATAPATTCSGIAGYNSFTMALNPTSVLSAQRTFFVSSADGGLIHFAENRPATISDQVMPVSVVNLGSLLYQPLGTSATTPTGPTNPTNPAGTYSGTMALQVSGGCNVNGVWAPYGTSQTVTTGTLTLDANGNVTASSFPNGVSFSTLNSGIPASQFTWYAGEPNDTGIGGFNITTLAVNTATDGGVTFSGNSLATFSSGYQSFSWVGGLTSSEPGCQLGTGGMQITISMHQ